MTGGAFFLLAPLFVLALLLLLSFLLYREYQNLPPGAVSPWPWVLAGFFWSVFHSPIPYSWQSPHGNTVFNGCFVNVTSQGPKNFSGIFLADFPDGKRSKILLSLPVSRVLGSLRAGECFSGDVFLSDYPDRRSSRHRFLGFLDNGILQGQIRPWNVFVRDRQSGHPKDWRTFFNGVPARVASLEALLESHFPDDVSSLIEAMVLSDTSHVPSRMNDVFLGSGVYHLLSVSGEHMGLLAAFLSGGVLVCIRFLPLGILRQILARIFIPRLLAVLVIPVLIVYTILIGIPQARGPRTFQGSSLPIFQMENVQKFFYRFRCRVFWVLSGRESVFREMFFYRIILTGGVPDTVFWVFSITGSFRGKFVHGMFLFVTGNPVTQRIGGLFLMGFRQGSPRLKRCLKATSRTMCPR